MLLVAHLWNNILQKSQLFYFKGKFDLKAWSYLLQDRL